MWKKKDDDGFAFVFAITAICLFVLIGALIVSLVVGIKRGETTTVISSAGFLLMMIVGTIYLIV